MPSNTFLCLQLGLPQLNSVPPMTVYSSHDKPSRQTSVQAKCPCPCHVLTLLRSFSTHISKTSSRLLRHFHLFPFSCNSFVQIFYHPHHQKLLLPSPQPYNGEAGTCHSFLSQCFMLFELQPSNLCHRTA